MQPRIENAQQILDIIEPIPADKFCTGAYKDSRERCCTIGFINLSLCGDALWSFSGFGARDLSIDFMRNKYGLYCDISTINNHAGLAVYTEPVIKDRVVHLLKDMILAEY